MILSASCGQGKTNGRSKDFGFLKDLVFLFIRRIELITEGLPQALTVQDYIMIRK
jgi:hypothetical protein